MKARIGNNALGQQDLKSFLDEKHHQFERPSFIEEDPIAIPHRYSRKEDIEIAGLLAATIAWGQRKTIVKNGHRLMDMIGDAPHEFVLEANKRQLDRIQNFVHRTFNGEDLRCFILALRSIYQQTESLEMAFHAKTSTGIDTKVYDGILQFRHLFFAKSHPQRTEKHVSNPAQGSAAKRLNMFLRWMVRSHQQGVDFGIWKESHIRPGDLLCPLDLHSGNVARKLGLLNRRQDDWQAVIELTNNLKQLDPKDPVKYDFALFGLGIYEKF